MSGENGSAAGPRPRKPERAHGRSGHGTVPIVGRDGSGAVLAVGRGGSGVGPSAGRDGSGAVLAVGRGGPGVGPPVGRDGSGVGPPAGRDGSAPATVDSQDGSGEGHGEGQAEEDALDGRTRAGAGPVVAVTGAARGIGHALASRLAESSRVGRVIAIDDHRGDVGGVTWRLADIRDPSLAQRLAGVDVLVHTDLDLSADSDHRIRRAYNVRAAQTVLTSAAAGRVGRVVLVTSALVYGARADNAVPLPEDAPLAADPDGSLAGDLLEIEHLAQRARRTHPGMAVTVVRPAALAGEGVDTLVTRHFEASRLLTVKGCAPSWQFCHVDDLVSALELAVSGDVVGEFAVGCEGWLGQEQVEEISGMRRIELPAGLTLGTAQRLQRIGVTAAPLSDLRYLVFPWVVDCQTLRQAGWRPAHDNADVLRSLMEVRAVQRAAARRSQRKEAAITAAGATVAAIGTAAIVAAARRRKRGN